MVSLMDDSPTNAAEFTVSELSGSIRRTVEDAFGNVRVRGEISGYRGPHSSGHAYFSLKDDRARIEAVIWKGVFSRLKHRPEEGLEVIASGKITTYAGSSKYQIVIEALEPAGAGALMALIEERRRKLAAEGLFDEGRKQLLPYMPMVIGVVTSPTGAVIRDILHRIEDRFPVHVIVWPVRVQGDTSGDEVSRAINGFNAFSPNGRIRRPDLIIVARGGGSLEDLWGFNDEAVVRAAGLSSRRHGSRLSRLFPPCAKSGSRCATRSPAWTGCRSGGSMRCGRGLSAMPRASPRCRAGSGRRIAAGWNG